MNTKKKGLYGDNLGKIHPEEYTGKAFGDEIQYIIGNILSFILRIIDKAVDRPYCNKDAKDDQIGVIGVAMHEDHVNDGKHRDKEGET